jgi:hypothetical protein
MRSGTMKEYFFGFNQQNWERLKIWGIGMKKNWGEFIWEEIGVKWSQNEVIGVERSG